MIILACLTCLKIKNILHKIVLYWEEPPLKIFCFDLKMSIAYGRFENDYKFYK